MKDLVWIASLFPSYLSQNEGEILIGFNGSFCYLSVWDF